MYHSQGVEPLFKCNEAHRYDCSELLPTFFESAAKIFELAYLKA